jgi:hypothetical protein
MLHSLLDGEVQRQLFISTRIAASWIQPLQVMAVPRDALIVLFANSGCMTVFSVYLLF